MDVSLDRDYGLSAMTIDYCNFIANKLVALTGYNGAEYWPKEITWEGPFNAIKDGGDSIKADGCVVLCNYLGFRGSQYGVPKSKGGLYVTPIDLTRLFSLGITYGINKVYGWKAHWNKIDAGTSYVGGYCKYGKGSVIRHSSGKKLVCRKDYPEAEPPEKYEDTEYWKTIRCDPKFYFDRKTFHVPSNFSSITTLPKENTTKSIVVGPLKISTADTGGFLFLYKSLGTTYINRDKIENEICATGNFSMKLSVYNDIYTNRSHKDAYIEVLHQESYVGDFGYQGEFLIRNPHKVVPWSSRLPCYVYLEYDNGRTESDYLPSAAVWSGGILENSEELMLAKIVRQLQPPTV